MHFISFELVVWIIVSTALHNCMATADRVVVVIIKEFQWDQTPQPLQSGLIQHSQKNNFYKKKKKNK